MKPEDKATKVRVLYNLLTELEKIGCFEIKTDDRLRLKISEFLIEVIENDLEYELAEKVTRWL